MLFKFLTDFLRKISVLKMEYLPESLNIVKDRLRFQGLEVDFTVIVFRL